MDSVQTPTWTRSRTPERITYTPPYTLSTSGRFDHTASDMEGLDMYRNQWSRGRTPEGVTYTPPYTNHSPAGSRASSTHSVRSMIDERMEWAHQERVRSASRGPAHPESPFREDSPYYAEYTGLPAVTFPRASGQSTPGSRRQSFSYGSGSQSCTDTTKTGQKRRASSPPLDGECFPTASTEESKYHNRGRYFQSSDGAPPASCSQSSHSLLSSAQSYTARSDSLVSPSNTSSSDSRSIKNRSSQLRRLYHCKCCALPRTFDTADDFRLHLSEKPYKCRYCLSRFKRKTVLFNHLRANHSRRYFWSCAARTGPETSFSQSTADPDIDLCGYCGQQFANPPNWEFRAKHLNQVHKVDECDKTKQFRHLYLFRRHLMIHHAGVTGEWSDIAEDACMEVRIPSSKRKRQTELSGDSEASIVPTRKLGRLLSTDMVLKNVYADLTDTDTRPRLSRNLAAQGYPAFSPTPPVPTAPKETMTPPPAEAFFCSTCQQSFTRLATLENHQRSHTGEKPFSCRVSGCSQRFGQKGDRARHEQAQHCEKTFVCGAESNGGSLWGCGKAFSRKDGLLEHQRKTAKGRQCLVEREKFLESNKHT